MSLALFVAWDESRPGTVVPRRFFRCVLASNLVEQLQGFINAPG